MVLYRDLDISFLNNPLSGDLDVVEDEAAVSQSVKNLILTSLYERPFQPSLGSIINQLLFAPYDKITRSVLAQTIKETVDKFEPRVELKFVDFYEHTGPDGSPIDANTIVISVGFLVLNKPNLVTISIVLRRLR